MASSPAGPITGGFADYCDWRLASKDELQTILLEPFVCGTSPCIDPIFGPTAASVYWSATTVGGFPNDAWLVDFRGIVAVVSKGNGIHVRAIRGGR